MGSQPGLAAGRTGEECMRQARILLAALAIAAFGVGAGTAMAQNEQFIPRLVYRTGPYAPNGIPFANGYADYLDMINARDGGVGGVKITYEECETGYNNDKGVECYERLKNKGPTGASLVDPLSTGITYALIERRHSRQDPGHLDGLRPRRCQLWRGVPVCLQRCRPPTGRRRRLRQICRPADGRHGQAQGQEDRPRLSSTSPMARSRSRRSKSWRRNTASPS